MSSPITIEEYCDIKTVVYETFPSVIADIIGDYQGEKFSECEVCSQDVLRRVDVEEKHGAFYQDYGEDEDTGFMILCAPMCMECGRAMCWTCWGDECDNDNVCLKCDKEMEAREAEDSDSD